MAVFLPKCLYSVKFVLFGTAVVFGKQWFYSTKVVVFGKSGCIRAKVVIFGQI